MPLAPVPALQNVALSGEDVWAGLSDQTERRKRQNRLNKRAERRRKRAAHTSSAPPFPSAIEGNLATQQTTKTYAKNGGFGSLLLLRRSAAVLPNTGPSVTHASHAACSNTTVDNGNKRWAPKVTTGCISCKMPHLECDENRRACIRCVTSRQHCGGYAEPAASAPKMPRQPSSTLVGLYYNAAPPDRELFFVLRTVALRSFSGVFDRDFWAIDVVRAAQIYPAVWYAGLALAAAYRGLHGAVQAPNMKSQHDDYALLLYSKCMHSVIGIIGSGELSKADQEAVLLSNILLIGFCCLRRDNTAAFDHMGKGLQVFCSWSFYNKALKPSEQAAVVDARSLTLLFRRFGLQYGSSDRPDARQSRKPVPRTLSNAAFTSATEACYEFLAFQIGISNALAAAGDTDVGSPQPYRLNPDALHAYRMLFSHWENKFRVLIQSPSLQASELEGILTLQIWAAVSRIRLYCQRTDRPGADVAYDEWQPTFQHMAALCEQLYAAITTNTDRMELPYTSLLFSFGLSVCEPLMYAVRCYDGGVRRRIIAFLRKWPRRDGVLDPKLAAAIIEETMLYEEALAIKSKRKGSNVCQCIPIEYVCGGHRVIRNKVRNVREGVSELTLTTEISLEPVELGCCSGKKVLITW